MFTRKHNCNVFTHYRMPRRKRKAISNYLEVMAAMVMIGLARGLPALGLHQVDFQATSLHWEARRRGRVPMEVVMMRVQLLLGNLLTMKMLVMRVITWTVALSPRRRMLQLLETGQVLMTLAAVDTDGIDGPHVFDRPQRQAVAVEALDLIQPQVGGGCGRALPGLLLLRRGAGQRARCCPRWIRGCGRGSRWRGGAQEDLRGAITPALTLLLLFLEHRRGWL